MRSDFWYRGFKMKVNVMQAAIVGGVIGWAMLFIALVFGTLIWRLFDLVVSWVF